MIQPAWIYIQLDLELSDTSSMPPAAMDWFDTVLSVLDQASYVVAKNSESKIIFESPRIPLAAEDVWGPPGGAWIRANVTGGLKKFNRSFRGSRQNFGKTLLELGVGQTLSLRFWPLDEAGRPVQLGKSGWLSVGINQGSKSTDGPVLRLVAGTYYWPRLVAGLTNIRTCVEGRKVVRGVGGVLEDVFAEQWLEAHGGGEKNDFLRRTDVVTGYNWITVVSPELAQKIGIKDTMDSKPLHVCEVLKSGSLWLQATADPSEYDLAAAHRLTGVIRDVLPPGNPAPHWLPSAFAPLVVNMDS